MATTTLSSSVNMPVQLVIVTSPYGYSNSLMNFRTYKQMVGRAGRKGLHEKGNSILICNESKKVKVHKWLKDGYLPISSFLISEYNAMSDNTFGETRKRFTEVLLNLIHSGINSEEAIQQYLEFTLHYSENDSYDYKVNMKDSLHYLLSNGFIDEESDPSTSDAAEKGKVLSISDIGSATAWSSLSPEEALALHHHLEEGSKRNFLPICYTYLVSL